MLLWLVGMMGSGKSAVGRRLAERRQVPFIDTDELIEVEAGTNIGAIWEGEGQESFRQRERRALASIDVEQKTVIATGGGAVLDQENVALMRRTGTVVWLDAEPSTLASRVGHGDDRPLLAGTEAAVRLQELSEQRRSAYQVAAHYRVATDGRSLDEVADAVEAHWDWS